MQGSSRSVLFATGNKGKVDEARVIFAPFKLGVQHFDGKGVEVQADSVSQVAAHAARTAANRYGRALMVEDAGLFVDSLSGFPGPYSAYVFKTIGIEGVLSLVKGKGSSATFRSAVAYCEPSGDPVVFEGSVSGSLTGVSRGAGGFGFDPVFLPQESSKTLAEMTLEEKCAVSHRGDAMRQFATWFVER